MKKMKRIYKTPSIDRMETVAMEMFCQSIEEYKIQGDSYDDDSD